MNILSYNPGHDGAFAYLEGAHLVASIEAEKHSRYRHSPLSLPDVFDVLGELKGIPDVLCRGGGWPSDIHLSEQVSLAGYRGVLKSDIPGHRYALLYGLADPTFDKSVAEFSRFCDAGKLMALASYSKRSKPSAEEEKIIAFLLQDCLHL